AAVHRAPGPTPARTEPPATPAAERDHARRRADPAIPGSPRSPRSHVPEPGAGTRATEDRGPASPRTWRPEADATAPPPSPPAAARAPARQPSAPRPPGRAPTGCWSGSSAARTPHDRPGSHTEESVPCRPDDLPASAPALAVPPPANAAHRRHEPAPTGPSPRTSPRTRCAPAERPAPGLRPIGRRRTGWWHRAEPHARAGTGPQRVRHPASAAHPRRAVPAAPAAPPWPAATGSGPATT